jgi:hypothetical protein
VPLVNTEAGTISWFAIQEGPSRFVIFDAFDDDAGRAAHPDGKVAAISLPKRRKFAGLIFSPTSFRTNKVFNVIRSFEVHLRRRFGSYQTEELCLPSNNAICHFEGGNDESISVEL